MGKLEGISNEELTRLARGQLLVYIQFPNKKDLKKASDILLDEDLPYDLVGFHALRLTTSIAEYLKKVHGLGFYETPNSKEIAERYDKGLVKR